MNNTYNICYKEGTGRLEDRKSVFIGEVFPVHSEEEAAEILEKTRKKYWDANHHCYAYTISGVPEKKKFSDDGEPSQTAGKPMLDVLELNGIHDVLAIVTRYFGGTLLGTGGLVRAYQGAVKDALSNAEIIERHEGCILTYLIDYDFYGKLQKFAEKEPVHIIETEFTDKVKIILAVDKSDSMNIINKVEEMSAAKALLTDNKENYFLITGNKVVLV